MNEQPNLILIQQLADGDVAFEAKLLGVIKKELPLEIKAYIEYYTTKEYEESANIVHKIKHKISILGLVKSHRFSEDYENELRENNTSKHLGFLKILDIMINFLNHY